MPKFMFTIAIQEYSCPRCNAEKGSDCITPKGRKTNKPHVDRTMQLTDDEIDSCTIEYDWGNNK
jgi:transcription elongation factor Elf1